MPKKFLLFCSSYRFFFYKINSVMYLELFETFIKLAWKVFCVCFIHLTMKRFMKSFLFHLGGNVLQGCWMDPLLYVSKNVWCIISFFRTECWWTSMQRWIEGAGTPCQGVGTSCSRGTRASCSATAWYTPRGKYAGNHRESEASELPTSDSWARYIWHTETERNRLSIWSYCNFKLLRCTIN